VNISGIFILFAHWSDYCVDRNDKVFTLLYYIVMHKKLAHPYIWNTPFPLYRWLAVGPNFGRLYYI